MKYSGGDEGSLFHYLYDNQAYIIIDFYSCYTGYKLGTRAL